MSAAISRLFAFVVAIFAAYLFGTLTYSQLALAPLVEMGMPVDSAVRMGTFWHDFTHMFDLYLPLLTVALFLGFTITRIVLRWVPQLRTLGFILAGFCAMWLMDYLLGAVLTGGTHPIPVTRFFGGWLTQCLAGALGGYVYVLMRAPAIARA